MDENTKTQKPYNLEPNVEAALAYLIAPITSVIILYYEKDNKFVRFHAIQSIFLVIAAFIATTIANMTIALLIGIILAPLVSILSFVVWLYAMYQAFNNVEWEIPYIGKLAKDQL